MIDITKSDFLIDCGLVEQENLLCWKREYEKFNIYFFTSLHDSESDLVKSYEKIRDYIAIYFQGDFLKLDVERWNIYQFHILNCSVDPNVKQVIEQDKFSTRKIVLDGIPNEITEDKIKDLINDEVFTFSVNKRSIPRISILDIIGQHDQELASYLKQEMPPKDKIIESLINKFGNDQD